MGCNGATDRRVAPKPDISGGRYDVRKRRRDEDIERLCSRRAELGRVRMKLRDIVHDSRVHMNLCCFKVCS